MKPTLGFRDDLIDKEVSKKLSKEVSSYIIEQLKNNMDNSIEERARLAAWQIFEEIGLSKHSVDRVSEIIAEKIIEQKAIDEEVRLKNCDDMTQTEYDREVAFAEWYCQNGKGTPTYSDAIEWARLKLIDKACKWLKARNVLTDASIEGFRKAMDE